MEVIGLVLVLGALLIALVRGEREQRRPAPVPVPVRIRTQRPR